MYLMYKWEWYERKILGKNILGKPLEIQSERSKEHIPSLREQKILKKDGHTQVASKVKDKQGEGIGHRVTIQPVSSCGITPIS